MTKVGYLNRFVLRTAIKLFAPLVSLSCVYMIVLAVGGGVNVKEIFHEAVTAGDTLFLPNSWYVFALMFYSALFWCVGRFGRDGARIALLLGLAVVQYCFFRWIIHWGFVWWWSGWSFFIGVLVAHYEKRLRQILDLHPSGVIWSVALFYLLFSGLKFATRACWPIISEVPNACTGLIVYLLVSKFGTLPWGRNLGKVSYEIYLAHGIFIVMFRSLGLGDLEYCLLVIVATIIVAFGLNRVHGGLIRYLTAKVGLR